MFSVDKIFIASDHCGVELKSQLIDYIKEKGITALDLGTNSSDMVDYPKYAKDLVSKMIGSIDLGNIVGVLVCKCGVGMSIAANRFKGIRAALCTNELMAEYSRLHNNANVLVLGSLITDAVTAKSILDKFITTRFEGGRHQKRIDDLDHLVYDLVSV